MNAKAVEQDLVNEEHPVLGNNQAAVVTDAGCYGMSGLDSRMFKHLKVFRRSLRCFFMMAIQVNLLNLLND